MKSPNRALRLPISRICMHPPVDPGPLPSRCRSKSVRSATSTEHDDVSAVPVTQIERVFRQQYGRAVAVLVRSFGSIDIAEEAVQDAFTQALQRWPSAGLPPSPVGWIITTARNRAIDRSALRPIAIAATDAGRGAQSCRRDCGSGGSGSGPCSGQRARSRRIPFVSCHPGGSVAASGSHDRGHSRIRRGHRAQ